MAEENKKSIDELQTSADSLLARLNGQLGAEASKSGKDEGSVRSDDGHTGGFTDEKYSELYEKYLGEKPSQKTGSSGYEALHERIVDLQKEVGGDVPKEPDDDVGAKPSEDSGAELSEEKADVKAEGDEDDEYWAMMKTVQISPSKKEEHKSEEAVTEETSELQKNIEDAENYVEQTYPDEDEPAAKPVKNVDNYSTNPEISRKKDKKGLFSKSRRDKSRKEAKLATTSGVSDDDEEDFDEASIDRLGSTDELIAFEPPLPDDEKQTITFTRATKAPDAADEEDAVTAEVDKADAETEPKTPKDPSDTAMMMMAFGYEPEKEEEKAPEKEEEPHSFDEYSFSDTDELSTTANLGDTSMFETETTPVRAVTEMMNKPMFEYTGADNNRGIFENFRKKFNSLRLRMIICAVLAAGLLIWEFILPVAGVALDTVVFVAVDWLLTFACAMLVCDRLIYAAKRIAKFGFDADTVTLVMFVLSLITSVVALIAADAWATVVLYNFTFALCAFFNLISAFMLLNRDVYSFKVISSSKTKKVLARVGKSECAREDIAFKDYLNDASEVCKVKRTNFISDFFSNKEEEPSNRRPLKILIPAVFALSVIAFLVSMFAIDDCDLYQSVTNAYITFIMTAPLSVFLSFAYSAYLGSARAYAHDAAILSEATPEKYSNAAVITFTDEDAFPADRIKLKSVKVIDNRSIEKVIYYASSVFSKIGGPLSTVFKAAALDTASSENVEIKELSDYGIDAVVDGKHIVVGQPEYMENQCFEVIKEDSDAEYGGRTNRRIMYLACDEVIIAKFYIQYNTSPDFIYIVKHLFESGVCVAISTIDPCIDDDILYKNRLDPEKYAVKIIKGSAPEDVSDTLSAYDSGIASTGSLKGMIKTFMLCDRLCNLSKTNLAMKIVSAVIGAVIVGLVIGAGATESFLSIIPALYQLFWMIPMFLVSKVYIR